MKIKIDCKTQITNKDILNICERSVDRERPTHRFLINGDYHLVSVIKKKYGLKIKVRYEKWKN